MNDNLNINNLQNTGDAKAEGKSIFTKNLGTGPLAREETRPSAGIQNFFNLETRPGGPGFSRLRAAETIIKNNKQMMKKPLIKKDNIKNLDQGQINIEYNNNNNNPLRIAAAASRQSYIFNKYLNNKYKIIPFNVKGFEVGEIKYYPPASKEWKNSIYSYNKNNLKNFPVYDNNINYLIYMYFNSRFNYKYINKKYQSKKQIRLSMNKIYLSKAEIKHTNSKSILTVYTYNREKLSLLKKIQILRQMLVIKIKGIKYLKLNRLGFEYTKFFIKLKTLFMINNNIRPIDNFVVTKYKRDKYGKLVRDKNGNLVEVYELSPYISLNKYAAAAAAAKLKLTNSKERSFTTTSFSPIVDIIKNIYSSLYKIFNKDLFVLRRLKLRLSLNNYKFEEKLLYILSSLISKYYNKKVIFNIVNMRSIIFNSDLFTKILTLKLKRRNSHIIRLMNIILNKAVLPKVNRIIEKSLPLKIVNLDLLENKHKNINLNSILTFSKFSSFKNNLDRLLKKYYENITLNYLPYEGGAAAQFHYAPTAAAAAAATAAYLNKDTNIDIVTYKKISKCFIKLEEILFNSIKYKNMGGVRLEVKGRLTKRYRADRALYKVRWKGGLKNIDASYKKLSTIIKRGYIKPNVEYSIFTSKRRIGAFAVKGWLAGK